MTEVLPEQTATAKRVSPMLIRFYYFLFFAILGSYMPYLNVYLKDTLHLGDDQIGSIYSMRQIMLVVAPLIWGIVADRLRMPKPMIAVGLLFSVLGLWLFTVSDAYWQVLLVMLGFAFFNAPVFPLNDSITFSYLAVRPETSYGRIRCWGSFGFVCINLLFMFLLGRDGSVSIVFYIGMLAAFATFLMSFTLPSVRIKPRGMIAARAFRLFLSRELFVLTLCGVLSRSAMMAYYSFFSIYLNKDMEYPAKWIGVITAVGAIAEIPFIFYAENLLKRFGIRLVYGIGIGAVAFRLFVLFLQPPAAIIVLSQLLHAFTFGAVFITGLIYVNQHSPEDLRASSQSLFTAALQGAGGALGCLAAGYVAKATSATVLMGWASAWAAGGLLLFLVFFKPQSRVELADAAAAD